LKRQSLVFTHNNTEWSGMERYFWMAEGLGLIREMRRE
jgi:hypothetical protein